MLQSSRCPSSTTRIEQLSVAHLHAAGLDTSVHEIVATVSPDHDDQPVEAFGTLGVDLAHLADWLVHWPVDTVALESTSLYWIPVFEVLKARGIATQVVNARHVKRSWVGNRIGTMPNGYNNSMRSVCYAGRCDQMRRCAYCGPIYAIAQIYSNIGPT